MSPRSFFLLWIALLIATRPPGIRASDNCTTPLGIQTCSFTCLPGDTLIVYISGPSGSSSGVGSCGTRTDTVICNKSLQAASAECSLTLVDGGVGKCAHLASTAGETHEKSGIEVTCHSLPRSRSATSDREALRCIVEDDPEPDIVLPNRFDMCKTLFWARDNLRVQIAHDLYEYQFPGCVGGRCYLSIGREKPWQPSPEDRTAPFYKGPPSSSCRADDVCLAAEAAVGFLLGWNGTSIIRCLPGTEATSVLLQPECARNGTNVAFKSTAYTIPRIAEILIPFGAPCVDHSYEQAVRAELILGPLGERYTLGEETSWSPPGRICNTVRLGAS